VRDLDALEHEQCFYELVQDQVPGVDDWYHADDDGTPWMVVSYDFVVGQAVRATLRVDYDGARLRGGWSPGFLNWDDGVRAEEALIDTNGKDGLHHDGVEDPKRAAGLAAEWFRDHIERRADGSGAPSPC
jgi:hypothetical protein